MMRENVLKDKSYSFALHIIKVYKGIISDHKEFVLSKQLLRAGTSIGALIREAEFAQSKPDFISKLSISLKEANETEYWIHLLCDTAFLSQEFADVLLAEVKDIISLLVVSIKTTKAHLKNEK